jgi:hypothetical protein
MFDVRSRAAVVGTTAGAAVLLALPVVSWAQVPGVDQVVGKVGNTVQGVTGAVPAAPARPAPAPAPAPAAAKPAPASSAPAPAAAPAAPAAQRSTATSSAVPATGGASTGSSSGSSGRPAASASASSKRGAAAHAVGGGKASASAYDGAATDTQIADDPASAPRDASPASLPFTGLALILVAIAGMAALATGGMLRRFARG